MTRDSFQDGRSDVLSEVRRLRNAGLWTRVKRANWLKTAISTYEHFKHENTGLRASYLAGRITALKSKQTADFSEPRQAWAYDLIVYRPLLRSQDSFCGLFDCWSKALWGICLRDDPQPCLLLCDPCRQEWQRTEIALTG